MTEIRFNVTGDFVTKVTNEYGLFTWESLFEILDCEFVEDFVDDYDHVMILAFKSESDASAFVLRFL